MIRTRMVRDDADYTGTPWKEGTLRKRDPREKLWLLVKPDDKHHAEWFAAWAGEGQEFRNGVWIQITHTEWLRRRNHGRLE